MGYRISVIIPVYNAEKYLKQCLNSVVSQTIFKSIEVVAVNDGSTDNSAKILQRYASQYDNIKIITQNNQGIANARKSGLVNSSGDYIAMLDNDDFVESNMYERLLTAAEENDADYVYCNYRFYPKKVSLKEKWFKQYKGTVDWRLIERNTQPWNKLIRRDLIDETKTVDIISVYSDSVYVNLLMHAKKIVCIDEELYNYRVGHSSVSGSYIGKLEYYKEVCERAKKQGQFIRGTQYEKTLKEYFEYRYIFTLLQVCIVAAVNDNKSEYKEARRKLLNLKYKRNLYTRTILKENNGFLKMVVMVYIIPNEYHIARLICRYIFR